MARRTTATRVPQLLKFNDLVERLQLCPAKLYKDMSENKLRPTRIGRALRFREQDVLAYINQ